MTISNKIFYLLALSTLLFAASCQKEAPITKEDVRAQEIILIPADEDSAEAKTYLDNDVIKWGKDEYVMMYYNDGADKYAKSSDASASAGNGKAKTSFAFSISPSAAASYTLGGAYPQSAVKATSSATAVSIKLPAEQNATASAYDPSAFVMILKPQTVTTIPSQWTAYFRRATALNKLTLTGVKEAVYRVEITAPSGVNLAGEKSFNLKTGANGSVTAGTNTIAINYATPLPKGNVDIWFTSWDSTIASGKTLTIKVFGANNLYSKTITAAGSGIRFIESELNKLKVDFSSVSGTAFTLNEFAQAYARALDTWENTRASKLDIGGIEITGRYIPENFTVKVGAKSYNKANTYDIALQGFVSLVGGSALSIAIPAPSNYSWAPSPYNEADSNGGEFQNTTVDLNFLKNYASRMQPYAKSNSRWSNFCNYSDSDGNIIDKGTPSVAGLYGGVCCASRSYLIMARFYDYLIKNKITSKIPTNCASMKLNATLFGYEDINEITIKAGSYNLWVSDKTGLEGKWQWTYRKNYLTTSIVNNKFDIFGFQEYNTGMRSELPALLKKKGLTNQLWKWFGRDAQNGKSGEAIGIAYNKDKFTIADYTVYWISETPDKVSYGWDETQYHRIVASALFTDKKSGITFRYTATHMPLAEQANAKGAELINSRETARGETLPSILVGDMNAKKDSPASVTFRTCWTDTFQAIPKAQHVGPAGTYNAHDASRAMDNEKYRIDYVYYRGNNITPVSYKVDNTFYDGVYPSDHLPVIVEYKLTK